MLPRDPCPPGPAGSALSPQRQELPMAVTGPGALCRGHQEAGAGLSQLQGLILETPFTGVTVSPTKPELRLDMRFQGFTGQLTLCSSSLPRHL